MRSKFKLMFDFSVQNGKESKRMGLPMKPLTKKEMDKSRCIIEMVSLTSNPIIRWYDNFIYKTKLDKFELFYGWIDRILITFHLLIFKKWIEKNLRQYLHVYLQYGGVIPIFYVENGKVVRSKEYEYLQKETSSFMSLTFFQAIAEGCQKDGTNGNWWIIQSDE